MEGIEPFEIRGHPIGPGHPTYIIAELSGNHNQDFNRAIKLIDAAAEAGANAVKLQTYTADTMTIDSEGEPFRIGKGSLWEGRTLYDLYEEAHTPWDWQPDLKKHAESRGLDCFSTPFDSSAVGFLEEIDVPAYKIASFEITHLPLIKEIASKGRPIIMSTGMATISEIDEAVRTVRENGDPPLALMNCNSSYPASPTGMNLRTIPHMMATWNVPVGLSDHTLGSTSSIAAVSLRASIIEKHLTLKRDHGGPDSEFSMEPDEFSSVVQEVRIAEQALGGIQFGPTEEEKRNRTFRRSLFVTKDMKEGEEFTSDNIDIIRPSHGLPPKHLHDVLGRRAAQDLSRGTPLEWGYLS